MDLSLSAVSWMSQTFPGKTDEEYRRHLGSFGITGPLGLQKDAIVVWWSKIKSCICGIMFKSATYFNPRRTFQITLILKVWMRLPKQ